MSKKEQTKKVSKNEEVKESKITKDVMKTTKKDTKTTKKESKLKKRTFFKVIVSFFKAIISFFKGVIKEMKHVRWPLKKEMVKYSIATLSFIIFFTLFFMLTDLIIAAVKMLVA